MQNNMVELFQNLKEEGYVDVYFLPEQYDADSPDFLEHGIKYDLSYDWNEFCRSLLHLKEETIQLINEEEKVFVSGNKNTDSQEKITYQIIFK